MTRIARRALFGALLRRVDAVANLQREDRSGIPDHCEHIRGVPPRRRYHADFTGASPVCATDYTDAKSTIRPDYRAVIRLPHNRLDVAKIQVLTGDRTDEYVYNLRGRLHGKTITGSFTESFTANPDDTASGVTCTSGKVTFSVKR